jgi:HTH-type transcriptional regulator / antitoxin HigA
MSIATIPTSYMTLLKQYPLHPIRNDKDYRRALAVLDQLAVRDEDDLDQGEADYLGVLTTLVQAYDQQHARIPSMNLKPHQRLRYLIEQAGLTQTNLAKLLGIGQPAVSLILSGHRALNRQHIIKLADHFKIEAGYFI